MIVTIAHDSTGDNCGAAGVRHMPGGQSQVISILAYMPWQEDISLEDLRRQVEAFAAERAWEPFHSPRNLLLALVSEVGELAELVRWQGDAEPAIPTTSQQDWADEIADVLILLLRLADRSGVDLPAAFSRKLALAAQRYPVDGFKGSPRKYNHHGGPAPPQQG